MVTAMIWVQFASRQLAVTSVPHSGHRKPFGQHQPYTVQRHCSSVPYGFRKSGKLKPF